MLLLNGETVNIKRFSDGTADLRIEPAGAEKGDGTAVLTWVYENDAEALAMYFLSRHLREHGVLRQRLVMPYIPNARMDRVKTSADVFTLKYFAELINSLRFSTVTVFDPHSASSEALIDRVEVIPAHAYIREAVKRVNDTDLLMFFPDEGAVKRYAESVELPYVYGMKNRDWETREIRGLTICGEVERVRGRSILMVDDICSSGRTLHYAAKKLKELGAGTIYLYVSHCENIVTQSDLLRSDIVEKIFTTRSFLRLDHPKLEILTDFTDV